MTSSKHLTTLNLHLCEENSNLNREPKEKEDIDLYDKTIKTARTVLLPLLRKFIYILKRETRFYKFKSLTEDGFALLNDNSYFSLKLESKHVNYIF